MTMLFGLERKKRKIRKKIFKQKKYRLTVYKSNKHIYTQLFTHDGAKVILSVSSLDKIYKKNIIDNKINKIKQAVTVGSLLLEKLKEKKIKRFVFDRSGLKFHGRIKTIANIIFKDKALLC